VLSMVLEGTGVDIQGYRASGLQVVASHFSSGLSCGEASQPGLRHTYTTSTSMDYQVTLVVPAEYL